MRHNKYKDIILKNKEYFDNMFCDVDSNVKLDYQQRQAIVSNSKYIMIIAGAGAGKTTTISAKVKYLIEKVNVKEEEILIFSFTNKAVLELKERINIDFGLAVNIKTFHSFGNDILKRWNKDIKIIANSEEILKTILNENINIKIKHEFKEIFLKNKFEETCISFLKLLKSKDIDEISIKKTRDYDNNKIFIDFIFDVYKKYNNYLRKNNMVDYDDLILFASQKIDVIENNFNYKYVFIDEYQDISRVRFNLIKKLVDLTNCNLVVVGDDWQSIYSFSGSEINLFNDFLNFDNVDVIKISNTYRNSQELINIAGKFIMKNRLQIRKKLKSIKRIKSPIEIIYYNDISNEYKNMLNKIKIIIKDNPNSEFAIMARYNHDLEKVKKESFKSSVHIMNIHTSKGLGFENVILINMSNQLYGFPSKIESNLYNKILIKNNQLEEERRLFYVALTRTKNKVYILVPKSKPSVFIEEISKYKNVKIHK